MDRKLVDIIPAVTAAHIQIIGELFREYEQFLQVDLCFQGFEEELASLPGSYAPPHGALLLAFASGQTAGCVAMRQLARGECEMKRLYVRPAYVGQGIGKRLATTVIAQAKAAGYARMYLDTLEKLAPALALYNDLGFRECSPYYKNPLSGVLYMDLEL